MPPKNRNGLSDILLDVFASGSAAALSKSVVAPVERLKLFYQVQHVHPSMSTNQHYKSALDFFTRIPREQGLTSLWRGNLANVLRYLPVQILNFSFNNQYKKVFSKYTAQKQSLTVGLLSGGLAGASSLTVVYPLDYVRTRMAVDNGRLNVEREFKNITDCFRKTYKYDGITGFYRGYTAGVTCYFLYRGCYFGFYEYIKQILVDKKHDMNILLRFTIAEAVSITSQSVAYPFDTVRRRMMMQNAQGRSLYINTLDCWRRIYSSEGLRGFYPGLSVNAFRSVGSALMLTLYDEIINVFNK